jgi:hypothetical protein
LIFKDYLVSMWYVILMRNSNSIMSINHLVGFYLPLVAKVYFYRFGDSVGSTPETPLVLPRRLWWFYPGDSGGSTPVTPVVQPRRLRWFNPGDSGPPRNFQTLWKMILNNLFEICFITLWGSIMLCAYYKSMKCVYLRLCHVVLIL